ncbi:YfbU family protein [Enterobacter sp.]|uniref:YfbU family protein n=1 Tax=Enterobacter sp. TaxID=42895 RepID=UPI00296F2AD5|nr:YfbU family protein [Enterobacter sp.]
MNIQNKINTILLCDIVKHLGIESEIDTDLVKHAITSGNLWMLNAEYSLLDEEESPKQARDFIIEVLNMYRGLSSALRKLPQSTQNNLVERYELRIEGGAIQIPGFDGNNEATYFSIVEAFLKMNKFVEQKEPINDTHSETVEQYAEMLQVYKKYDAFHRSFKLEVEEIASVLALAPKSA